MAPRISMQRRQTQSQREHVYAPGIVGRKTGITIPDNGRRDEHGFEDMDDLFSSPDRELQAETNGQVAFSDDEQDEQDMEIDDGSELGPATTRKLQQGGRRLFHDKTTLTNGHAKVNGATGRNKKPMAGRSQSTRSQEQPVPDPAFSEDEEEEDDQLSLLEAGGVDGGDVEDESPEALDQEVEDEAPIVQELKSTNKSKLPGRRGRKPKATIEKENNEPADPPSVNTSVENVEVEEPVKKRKGRPKTTASPKEPTPPADPTPPSVNTSVEDVEVEEEEPVKKRKGRPKAVASPKEPTPPADLTPPSKSSKRGRPARTSLENADEDNAESRGAKRPKVSAKADKAEQSASSKPAPTKEKGKPGRKRKSSGVGVESPKIQRGPPLPKGRGLVTLRREETTAMRTTRSGRASFKPLEWWKGEHVEYDEDQEKIFEDTGRRHFKMPTVKGVVRTEENYEAVPKRRGRQPTGRKPGRRPSAVAEEEEIERDDWEYDPGRVTGEVVCWEPEHEFEPPGEDDEVEIFPEELAISENAIQLRDIKDATFKFAKTLTLPFFGSGIVDLPPGAEKRPKNARKNHMVFFVHTGNVRVTIAQTEFTIANGGMFFVPRGNHYQIRNETDRSARIFFAQGCEVFVQPNPEGEE
ncbi:hypothetical protein CHU98_g2219 [Xylaria longipes]|nr:hypothetical protein CHU98_g2219 [Xylaria longipes]